MVVVGSSCAGKTTFARALAEALGCARWELDALHWGPKWQPKSPDEFRRLVAEAASTPEWVVDGNYRAVRDLLWPRAQTIVWLDYSYPRVLWRAFKRTARRTVTGEVLWHGNRESVWRALFTKQSILYWVATTHHRRRREFAALREDPSFRHLHWIEFKHPAQAAQWLAAL